ncbi:hypothetical protein [Hyalangium rubrum]|uniref:HEAT repeat domain-containing protein n=1 Tax=Hyalangium rubrum TaxID=3103134 RepID=A0ABU5HI21_9BACT|nr:hypothetical protein [Hyalangium sp. s54d21]MDY7233117.1 hypothetical protein [Hyalangium sp. s54d21]
MTPESLHRSASPTESPSSQRLRVGALALGTVALIAGVALIANRSSEEAGQGPTNPATAPGAPRQGPSGSGASAGHEGHEGSEKAREKGPRFSSTTCWENLEQFNETVTLDTFRAWAAPLLASKDPHVREYLKGRLAELIGKDEGRALEVLEWAREAAPAEFKVLMAGLRGSQAITLPKIGAQLTEMGLDERMDMGRRAGFLDELRNMPQLEPAALDRLSRFAQDPASGEAGWVTTRAIGQVMKGDFTRTGNAKPYLDKLFTIGTQSPDEPVRYLALEMEMHAEAPLDAQATEKLAKILATEGSENIREVAAHDLSLAEDKAKALEIYSQAFEAEKDLCVRWALFRFAARAAGKNALPVMANMAVTDPRFQANYHDFQRLYASGVLDFDRIWFGLPDQNPHGCLDKHE